MPNAQHRYLTLPGTTAAADGAMELTLLVREQAPPGVDRRRPVLYVHGATFPSACSILLAFDGVSWADQLNVEGFAAWAFDFAGFGGSGSYTDMANAAPSPGEPLGRAAAAARQIERVVRAIIAETGATKVSIIAHSWGTIATGLFATEHPGLVDRLVFFGPIVQRQILKGVPELGPWRLLTVEEQRKRFVEDVPAGHAPVLLDRHFEAWIEQYLAADPVSRTRVPPSIKTPNGPVADIMSAWSGTLAYDPGRITSPLAVVRGEWDSLCKDADAAWLLATLVAAPEKADVKVAKGTHLMHIEECRGELHRAVAAFLSA